MMALVGIGIILGALGAWWYGNRALRENKMRLERRTRRPEIAFLIPARYESAVIGDLLASIAAQTVSVKMKGVYVIVEDLADPTVKICKEYGASIIIREHPERQRKGHALDEAVRQILAAGRHYDLYFVFDADNRLAPTYLAEMLKTYARGYELATGYRHARNHNANVIAAASALTFTMINTLGNQNRVRHQANIIFSGTGCYVTGELVEWWGGWPFHSLTEDYEMSLYAMLENLSTYYNTKAVFYDEQPTSYRQTVDQRVRWIKGYFAARREYVPLMRECETQANRGSLVRECIGVKPIIWLIVGLACLLFDDVVKLCSTQDFGVILSMLVGLLAAVYVIIAGVTAWMIRKEKMKFARRMTWRVILFNPIYLVSYVPCALRALVTRDVEWKVIKHKG